MKLSEIIKEIEVLEVKGSTSVEINEVDIDSRKAGEGHLFVAVVGTAADGHRQTARHATTDVNQTCVSTYTLIYDNARKRPSPRFFRQLHTYGAKIRVQSYRPGI